MKTLKDHEIAKLIVLVSILFGGWVRFLPMQLAGFPINDGGMFYSMIEDLYTNHFLLPKFTSYNLLDIPFAYPPLGFYIGALLKALGVNTTQIIMFLPPAISTLAILAFCNLAHQIFKGSWSHTALATLAFALIPRSYSWFVMGGGLTRSLGQLFLLLFLASILKMYRKQNHQTVLASGILGGFAILSHPEISIHALTAAAVFWFFRSKKREGFLASLLVALIAILVSSPWWITILQHHGLSPFLNALHTGQHTNFATNLGNLMFFKFAEEPLASIVTTLGITGMLYQLAQKNFFLSFWLVIHFLTQPRTVNSIAIYPLTLLFAIALVEILFPAINRVSSIKEQNLDKSALLSKKNLGVIVFVGFYLSLGAFIYSLELGSNHLPQPEKETMQWIKEHTLPQSRFIVLSLSSEPMLLNTAEWFPALTGCRSQLTIQGREWIQGEKFDGLWQSYADWANCLDQNIECIENLSQKHNIDFDYIYISKYLGKNPGSTTWENIRLAMVEELKESKKYNLILENSGAILFAREQSNYTISK